MHADPLNLQQSIDAARETIDFEVLPIMFESPCVRLFKPARSVVLNAPALYGLQRSLSPKSGIPASA